MTRQQSDQTTLWDLVTVLQDEADAVTSNKDEADALICHAVLDFLEAEAAENDEFVADPLIVALPNAA